MDTEKYTEGNDKLITSNEEDRTISSNEERTCFQRWFGPMSTGSFRAGIFALVASAIGGGIQNLHLRCTYSPLRLQVMWTCLRHSHAYYRL